MPKEQISIKLDGDLLARADEAARAMGWSRSAFIERAIERSLDNFDALVEEMSRENPLTVAIMDRIVSDPKILKAVAGALGAQMDTKTADLNAQVQPLLRAEAERRKSVRKQAKRTKGRVEDES